MLLRADDFGVPQKRERVFIVGVSKKYYDNQNILNSFFEKLREKGGNIRSQIKGKTLKKTTVNDALSDLNVARLKINDSVAYSQVTTMLFGRK